MNQSVTCKLPTGLGIYNRKKKKVNKKVTTLSITKKELVLEKKRTHSRKYDNGQESNQETTLKVFKQIQVVFQV